MFIMTTCGPGGSIALAGKLLLGCGSVAIQVAVIFSDRIGEIAVREQGTMRRVIFLVAVTVLAGGVACLSISFHRDSQWGRYYASSLAHAAMLMTALLVAICNTGIIASSAYVVFATLLIGWLAIISIRSRNMVFR
jgi:hypothetical protein